MSTENRPSWSREARFDAAAAIAALGLPLVIEGPCRGGEVGAAYVRWPDGRRGVLSSGSASAAPVVALALAAGIPAARYDLVAEHAGRTVVVQERLPGAPPETIDAALVDELLAINDRFAGLFRGIVPAGDGLASGFDGMDLAPRELYLTSSGPGFCRHETLAAYDRRTARLLDWVRAVGATQTTLPGDDLMHLDYHPGNVLVTGDRITGVIDWDGAGRGDRHLDLVTLRFDLARRAPALGERLERAMVERVPAQVLRVCWAHMGLRLIDWAIRHHGPADVDLWLSVAAPSTGPLAALL